MECLINKVLIKQLSDGKSLDSIVIYLKLKYNIRLDVKLLQNRLDRMLSKSISPAA